MPDNSPVTKELLGRIGTLSPQGYAAAFRLRFSRPLLYTISYKKSWCKYYGENNLALCDPTTIWGLSHTGHTRWSEIRIPDPFDVFGKARKYDLNYGIAISVGSIKAKSILGCARSDREFSDSEIEAIKSLFVTIHDELAGETPLSDQQLEALRLFSHGYDYDEISQTLGISRTTLKYRLGGARKRLDARSNVDAVRIATERSLLNPHPYWGSLGS